MKLVLHHCLKPLLPPTKLLWCVCAAPSAYWFTQPGKEQETHFYTHLREWDAHGWLTFTTVYLYWKSQELEISVKAPDRAGASSPAAQDWAALSWFHLLLTSLNIWPITECLHAPWGKLHFGESPHTMWDFTRKTRKQTPAQGRKKKRHHFNEKESCSRLMSPWLESVCFKNAPRTLLINTIILWELEISWELWTPSWGCGEKVNDLMGWNN